MNEIINMSPDITLYGGDCIDVMQRSVPDNSVDLVVTSPPYDNLRKYDGCGVWNFETFTKVAQELYRVVKDGGVVVWVVNDAVINGGKTLTSFKQAIYFQSIGFKANDVMVWKKANPIPVVRSPRYSPCFEYMFVFVKGKKPKTFNPIMRPCKSAGLHYTSTVKNMGGESGRRSIDYHVNKETVDNNIWKIAVAPNKDIIVIDGVEIRHPAVFPLEIARRHIISWSNESDTILDPFMGAGTTIVAANNLKRKAIGIELNPNYLRLSEKRIKESLNH